MDLLSAKVIYWAAAGAYRCFSTVFPLCICGAGGFPVDELQLLQKKKA